ncbi:Intracellular protein transporter USO1-like protein [Heracleum sosnowskyi]|uniref:Intracellular protein transporter USO1-like protein n=1 Tax=Heracleum sosnowskyi TaxID=360622 RepID=A0AAD8ML16_9APIA|nr:Intracellular protein transporter USO1-like protein [Heracleum sosnowskyi]
MEKRQEKRRKVKKQEEFMGIKLKHSVSTPTTRWKIGLAQSDGSLIHLQNSNFPIINTLSAKKLGANLKKTQTHIKAINMNKGDSGGSKYDYEKEKSVEHQSHVAELPDEEQPASASSLRRHISATLFQHHRFVGINGHALQPVSLASCNSSLEVAPHYSAVTPASPLDFTDQGELSYNVKTSAELLKVLNRIWSLDEQHAANLSLMKTLQRELERSQAENNKLLQEKKRNRRDINKMMEQNASDIEARRVKEQDRTRNAVLSVSNELESERTLRKHSESLLRKLARELAEVKSSLSNSEEEIKREREARILLENLCDEFAKGITEYEQKARSLKHRPDEGFFFREHPNQLILHISESWLDERMQMKAAAPCGTSDNSAIITEKLSIEIESFLQSKQAVRFRNVDGLTLKTAKKNSLCRYSSESFHLNDAASAPRNGDCEEDSTGSGLKSLDFNKHSSGTRANNASKLLNDCGKKLMKSNRTRNKIQSGGVFKSNEYHSSSQNQFQKRSFTTVSSDKNNIRIDNYRKSETTEASQDHVLHSRTRNHSLSRNDGKLLIEKPCTDGSLDHSASSSHPAIKQEKPLRITKSKPEVSESSKKGLQGIKKHSLKARLLEAKLESRHSLTKNPKAPIY